MRHRDESFECYRSVDWPSNALERNGDIHVVCNGEIYNFRELRTDLEGSRAPIQFHSDVETIVHLYEEYGDDACSSSGMFGLAVLDTRRAPRVLLARDRLGKKPLFYAQQGDRIASVRNEIALSGHPELSRPNYRLSAVLPVWLYPPARDDLSRYSTIALRSPGRHREGGRCASSRIGNSDSNRMNR